MTLQESEIVHGTQIRVDPDGSEIFVVAGPDILREKLIRLHSLGNQQLALKFGTLPGRASLFRWRMEGFPVDRNGPRVILPTISKLKSVYTSSSALARWLRCIQDLGTQINQAGGVERWRKSRGGR